VSGGGAPSGFTGAPQQRRGAPAALTEKAAAAMRAKADVPLPTPTATATQPVDPKADAAERARQRAATAPQTEAALNRQKLVKNIGIKDLISGIGDGGAPSGHQTGLQPRKPPPLPVSAVDQAKMGIPKKTVGFRELAEVFESGGPTKGTARQVPIAKTSEQQTVQPVDVRNKPWNLTKPWDLTSTPKPLGLDALQNRNRTQQLGGLNNDDDGKVNPDFTEVRSIGHHREMIASPMMITLDVARQSPKRTPGHRTTHRMTPW